MLSQFPFRPNKNNILWEVLNTCKLGILFFGMKNI